MRNFRNYMTARWDIYIWGLKVVWMMCWSLWEKSIPRIRRIKRLQESKKSDWFLMHMLCLVLPVKAEVRKMQLLWQSSWTRRSRIVLLTSLYFFIIRLHFMKISNPEHLFRQMKWKIWKKSVHWLGFWKKDRTDIKCFMMDLMTSWNFVWKGKFRKMHHVWSRSWQRQLKNTKTSRRFMPM